MLKAIGLLSGLLASTNANAWIMQCYYDYHSLVGQKTLYQLVITNTSENILYDTLQQQNTLTGPQTVTSPWFPTDITLDFAGNEIVLIGTGGVTGNYLLTGVAYMEGTFSVPWPPYVLNLRYPTGGYDQCFADGLIAF